MKKTILGVVIMVILIAAAFYGGIQYAKTGSSGNLSAAEKMQQRPPRGGLGGPGVFAGPGRSSNFVAGEIIAADAAGITVKSADGGSKIIFISDSTKITKTSEGSLKDLVLQEQIMVNGTVNSDGSISAESIQIRPSMLPLVPAAPPDTPLD